MGIFFLFLLVVTAEVLTQVRTTFMPAEILAILSCYLPHCTDFQKYEYALFLESESTGLLTHIRCTQIWKNDLPQLFYRKDWSRLGSPMINPNPSHSMGFLSPKSDTLKICVALSCSWKNTLGNSQF